jgi:hypothetical protein
MPEWQPELPGNKHEDVRSHVLIAANMAITAFWDISSFVLEVGRRFRDAYCRHNLISVMTEAVCTPETSTYFNETARRCIPEVCNLRKQKRFENMSDLITPAHIPLLKFVLYKILAYVITVPDSTGFFLPEMSCFTKVIRFLRFHSRTSKYIIVLYSHQLVRWIAAFTHLPFRSLSITFAH